MQVCLVELGSCARVLFSARTSDHEKVLLVILLGQIMTIDTFLHNSHAPAVTNSNTKFQRPTEETKMPTMTPVRRHVRRNSSRRSQRRGYAPSWTVRIVISLLIILACYHLLWTYWLAGYNIPDVEVGTDGKQRTRRRPNLLVKHDHVADKDVPT